MYLKNLVFAMIVAAPMAAMAAHSGQYSDGKGNSVSVWSTDGGNSYNIRLSSPDCGTRTFSGAEEMTANKIMWNKAGCYIQVLNSDATSTVVAGGPGCDRYCDGNGTWDMQGLTLD